jgi:hypothetical protein
MNLPHCCPTNFVQYSCNLVLKGDFLHLLALPDMKGLVWAPLLPPGEGRDEGVKNQSIGFSDPLTPTLSLRERAFMGQQ